MRKTNLMVALTAVFIYLVGPAALASGAKSASEAPQSYIAQASPGDYYPPADPTMPSTQPYSMPGQAAPDLRPGYPNNTYPGAPYNGAPQVSVGHHHHHHNHSNRQHKHSHRIHVVRAVKHAVGFSAKAPFAVVP